MPAFVKHMIMSKARATYPDRDASIVVDGTLLCLIGFFCVFLVLRDVVSVNFDEGTPY